MAEHSELGKTRENIAIAYLGEHDYPIRHRNWKKGHFKLGVVAAKGDELVVVEMETRSNTSFAQPEEAVDLPEIKWAVRAADAYMKLFQIDVPIRFDIITVIGESGSFRIDHIKEVFYPPLF